ncbi:MAG: DUF4199 domain-containing protein [Flavobacterium sp.]|jgi:hypothetical protein|nr:DUF4199 domain-containing protein [Flavobacterium sp.]
MINETIKKNGLTFGVLSGIVSALITSTIYAIDLNLFVSWWIGVVSMVIYLIISVVLLTKTKKEMNGIFVFKDAFTTYFISAVVGTVIGTLFNILLFNVIDPSLQDTLKEITIKNAVAMMQKFNSPAAAINEMIAKMQENNPYSVVELLKGSVFSIVFSSIIGLIMAAFFKSKSQE